MGARGTKKKTSARAKGKAAPENNRNRNILLAVGIVAIVAVMAGLLYLAAPALILVLSTVTRVFENFAYHRQLASDDGLDVVLEFSANVGDKKLKGIDFIRFDEQGRIVEFEVMVRPLSGLQALGAAMGQRLADAGEVPEGRRQGTEPAPAAVMAGAVLVQQFFHLSRFQQQATTEWSRQRQFAAAHRGQAAGEFEQGPAARADQVVKLLVIDRSLCRLVGGEILSGRVVHDVFFSLPFRLRAVNRKSTFSGFPAT